MITITRGNKKFCIALKEANKIRAEWLRGASIERLSQKYTYPVKVIRILLNRATQTRRALKKKKGRT